MALLPASASENLKLQSNMKVDREGYSSELLLVYDQFKSRLDLFQLGAALNYTSLSGISAAEDLIEWTTLLADNTPLYPKELAQFPDVLLKFLESSARSLPSALRLQLTLALILLTDRKIIDITETLQVFMELQTLGDRGLQKLAVYHVIQSITQLNWKQSINCRNQKHEALQNILFRMLQQEDEAKAKRALITLRDLHRMKVWSDDRTANAICMACFHPSARIMIAALKFLLDFEKIEDDDSDDSDSEDDQAMYKASRKGTTSSKKKKAKQQQQLLLFEKSNTNYFSPLNHLKDAQGFSEKLFSRLQSSSSERLEVKMMMIKVIARTVGLHHLILLDFYPYLQKYVEFHQQDVRTVLAAAVHACHKMVPPDAVESLFKQIVNQFVDDRSRHEGIITGLNVVREMCLRMPLCMPSLMTEELLENLVLYRKSHKKAVSASAQSLLTLVREICPSLLVKKDGSEIGAEEESEENDDDDSNKSKEKKRKFSDFEGQLNAADMSLGALKKLVTTTQYGPIREIRTRRALAYDFTLEKYYVKDRLTKEELLAFKRCGWDEDKLKDLPCCDLAEIEASVLSNLQKEQKKPMPCDARKAKTSRTRQQKKMKQKQSRGRKAWK